MKFVGQSRRESPFQRRWRSLPNCVAGRCGLAGIGLLLAFGLVTEPVSSQIVDPAPIRVSEDGHVLVTNNGTPFFWMGDTAWSIFDQSVRDHPDGHTIDRYLQDRASKGYTVIQSHFFTNLVRGPINAPNAYGHRPFVGGDEHPDFTAPLIVDGPDNDYWDYVDYIVDRCAELGLYLAVVAVWSNSLGFEDDPDVNPIVSDPAVAYGYGRFLGSRYRDRTHIIWLMGGDAFDKKSDTFVGPRLAMTRSLAEGIADGVNGESFHDGNADYSSTLMSYHPPGGGSSSGMHLHNEPWLDFNLIQTTSRFNFRNYETVLEDYNRYPAKPTLDSEVAYENSFSLNGRETVSFPNRRIIPFEVRKGAYWSALSGSAGHTYGHRNLIGWVGEGEVLSFGADQPWYASLDAPGTLQMKYFHKLMMSKPLENRIPDPSLVVAGGGDGVNRVAAMRDSGGEYAMIYTPNGFPMTVDLSSLAGRNLDVHWFNPRTGIVEQKEQRSNEGQAGVFTPPTSGPEQDWVLILEKAGDARLTRIEASADTYLRRTDDGVTPSRVVHGLEDYVMLKSDPEPDSPADRVALVRFDVSGVYGTVNEAWMQLHLSRSKTSIVSAHDVHVYMVKESSGDEVFDESLLTAATSEVFDARMEPPIDVSKLDTLGTIRVPFGSPDEKGGETYTLGGANLAAAINADTNGTLTLLLYTDSEGGNSDFFVSRDVSRLAGESSWSHPPRLILSTETQVLDAVADTYVKRSEGDQYPSNVVHGSESYIVVKNDNAPSLAGDRLGFVRFDLPALDRPITNARLQFFLSGIEPPIAAEHQVGIYAIAETSSDELFDESVLTAANSDVFDADLEIPVDLSTVVSLGSLLLPVGHEAGKGGTSYRFEGQPLVDAVNADTNGSFAVALFPQVDSGNADFFVSKELSPEDGESRLAHPPMLFIETVATVVDVAADTYVRRSEDGATTSEEVHGLEGYIRIKDDNAEGLSSDRVAFLRFDLPSDIGSMEEAALELYLSALQPTIMKPHSVWVYMVHESAEDEFFDETSLSAFTSDVFDATQDDPLGGGPVSLLGAIEMPRGNSLEKGARTYRFNSPRLIEALRTDNNGSITFALAVGVESGNSDVFIAKELPAGSGEPIGAHPARLRLVSSNEE